MEGTQGICVTKLSASVNATAITIPVDSTEGFPGATYPVSQRYIVIKNECVSYVSTNATAFIDCERGRDNPRTGKQRVASAHSGNTTVMNVSSSAMNNLLAIFQAESSATFGTFAALIFSTAFWGALWQMLMWDYSFFTGQLIIIRIILMVVLSGGFLFSMVMAAINVAQGLFR